MTACARMTGAGARGRTSASPAATSGEAAPAWSPATSSTGEEPARRRNRRFPLFDVFSANVSQAASPS